MQPLTENCAGTPQHVPRILPSYIRGRFSRLCHPLQLQVLQRILPISIIFAVDLEPGRIRGGGREAAPKGPLPIGFPPLCVEPWAWLALYVAEVVDLKDPFVRPRSIVFPAWHGPVECAEAIKNNPNTCST